MISLLVVIALLGLTLCQAFRPNLNLKKASIRNVNGARGMTQMLDVLAGLSVAAQLNSATVNPNFFTSTLPVAVTEVKQGLYKEYTVERVDTTDLDKNVKTYKTAAETEENKTKYWAILAVLLLGSFAIPMIQYYWYVADTDD